MTALAIVFHRLDPVDTDRAALVDFLTRNVFPFHGRTRLPKEDVEQAIDRGAYRNDDNDSYWPVASVAYSILRGDWQSGTTTTFVWEDLVV